MTETPELDALVAGADRVLNKGTFSIVAAVQGSGTTYPTDDVVVNSDLGTAYEIAKLEKKANKPGADINAIDAEIDTLREKMKENSYVFHMRGISPGTRNAIDKEYPVDKPEGILPHNFAMLAAHIVRVTDVEGNVDEHLFTLEDVQNMADWLPDTEFDKIYNKQQELTFQASYIDNAMSADFLSTP